MPNTGIVSALTDDTIESGDDTSERECVCFAAGIASLMVFSHPNFGLSPLSPSSHTRLDVRALRDEVLKSTDPEVVLDLSGVISCLTSDLEELLELGKQLHTQGRTLGLVSLGPEVREEFHDSRMDSVFVCQEVEGPLLASRYVYQHAVVPSVDRSGVKHDLKRVGFPENFSLTDDDHRFVEDWKYAQEQRAAGAFEQFRGQFVGIFERQIVATSDSADVVQAQADCVAAGLGHKLLLLWMDDEFR